MIDKIKLREKIREKYQNRILEGDTKKDIAFKRGWNYALDAVLDILRDMPDDNNWIPVSERVPQLGESSEVLVSLENGGILTATYFFSTKKFMYFNGKGFADFYANNPVKAWQPLPVPYEDE